MVVSRLTQLTNREHTFLLLGVAFVKGVMRTMPQYQVFTPAWWMMLALNLVALPLGWLALYYVAPALGNAVGTGLAVLLLVAVPLAILAVMVWRILVPLVLKRAPWTFLMAGAQIEPEGTAVYSVANLFSLTKVPYRLHSLTGSLLE
jgi:hypothetical protein